MPLWRIVLLDEDGVRQISWVPKNAKMTVESPIPDGSVAVTDDLVWVKHMGGWSFTAPGGDFVLHNEASGITDSDETVLRHAKIVHCGQYWQDRSIDLNETPYIIDAEFVLDDVDDDYQIGTYYGLKELTAKIERDNGEWHAVQFKLPGNTRLEKIEPEPEPLPVGTVVGIFEHVHDDVLKHLYVKTGGNTHEWSYTTLGGVFIYDQFRNTDETILARRGARIVYQPGS